jgi:hypothetical protein
MRNGGLWLVERPPAGEVPRRLADLHHPAAVRTCDLDANGVTDLVAADLGSFPPEDHDRGRVVWLPDALGPAPRSPVPLLAGVGRVADVSVADFDGDGREDLVVAEFGWHKTGSIRLLTRREADDDGPALVFESIVLDDRSGAIHVPVADLNTDGRPDFVALFAQEHEIVVAFLNDGAGGFERETVYDARDPSVGSSGIELVDLDRDGDLDVLYTNGDTFDSTIVKPYHGVRWLENTGEFPFRPHELTSLPGVHRALAGDLDGDGDLDIAACALLPANLLTDLDPERCDALIWLEQTTPGQFERHVLERGAPRHAAMTLADLDGDGDLDLVSGVFGGGEGLPLAVIYWNE